MIIVNNTTILLNMNRNYEVNKSVIITKYD